MTIIIFGRNLLKEHIYLITIYMKDNLDIYIPKTIILK